MPKTCETCRWWDSAKYEGQCRRHAPRLSGQAAPHGNATHQDPMFRAWPTTWRDDWCGEHQPREED